MDFQGKPIIIQAVQFDGKNIGEVSKFIGKDLIVSEDFYSDDKSIHIETNHGVVFANKTDWIIRGEDGEYYPCKNDVFEKKYTRVLEDGEEI